MGPVATVPSFPPRSEEHTSELQSHSDLVCRLLLEKKKNKVTSTDQSSASTTSSPRTQTQRDNMTSYRQHRNPPPCTMTCTVYRRYRFFFFNDTATPEIYPLSLHDALPISTEYEQRYAESNGDDNRNHLHPAVWRLRWRSEEHTSELQSRQYLVCRLLL